MNDAGVNMSTEVDGGAQLQSTQTTQAAQVQAPAQQSQSSIQPVTFLFLAAPFVVFTLVLLVRALPLGAMLKRKPWSCDICISFWMTVLVGFALSWASGGLHWSWAFIHMLFAPGGAVLLLGVHRQLTAPVELPLPKLPLPRPPPSPPFEGRRIPKLAKLLKGKP